MVFSMMTPRSPTSLVDVAVATQAVDRSSVASLAFLVWDVLITLDQEVKIFWPRKRSFIKFLFFFVRYIPICVQVSILFVGTELSPRFHFTLHDCYIWEMYQSIGSIAIIAAVDLILILRVRALYYNNPSIRLFAAMLLAIEIVCMCVGVGLTVPGVRFNEICLVTFVPSTLLVYGVATIIFQTILFGLTAWNFFSAVRLGWGNVPLISLLMRDGTWAFFILFFLYSAQVGLYGVENHAFAAVLFGWTLTAFSFSGYRILLNINHLSEPFNQNQDSEASISESINFTSNFCSSSTDSDSDMILSPISSQVNTPT